MVVTVPAYEWAWSDHDVMLSHKRRYTRRRLATAAERAGLHVERVTYFQSALVVPALLLRRTPLRRLLRGQAEEASFVNPVVNRILVLVTSLERAFLRRWNLPFGLSILLVAEAGTEATASKEVAAEPDGHAAEPVDHAASVSASRA